MRKIIIVMLVCIMPHVAFAQGQIQADSNVVFALHERDHHYYFDGDIGGTPVRFALDTGSPAMLISEDFYDKHKDVLQLEVKDVVGKKLKIQRQSYNIRYRGRGHLSIGNAIYHGSVAVFDKLKSIEKEAGMIGVGFFISPVIFDFNKKKIYIKPNNQ